LIATARLPERQGHVHAAGIGKLVLVDRKARVGRNPATGEQIQIPASAW